MYPIFKDSGPKSHKGDRFLEPESLNIGSLDPLRYIGHYSGPCSRDSRQLLKCLVRSTWPHKAGEMDLHVVSGGLPTPDLPKHLN